MSEVDYIKLSATARHIMETVLHRASDNGIKLPSETVRHVLNAAVDLAFIAHDQKMIGEGSALKANTPSRATVTILEMDPDEEDPSVGDNWDYVPPAYR